MRHFISGKKVACDTEATGLRPWHGDRPFAFSFCNPDGDTYYIEWTVDPKTRMPDVKKEDRKRLRDFMEDERITKVFFNAKYDIRMIEMGLEIVVAGPGGAVREGGRFEEVTFKAHACNSREPSFGLKPLSSKYLDMPADDEEDLSKAVRRMRLWAKKEGWRIGFEEKENSEGELKFKQHPAADKWIPYTAWKLGKSWARKGDASLCKKYAVGDARRTMGLDLMYDVVMEDLEVRECYERELELFQAVYEMEDRGSTVHLDRIDRELQKARKILVESKKELCEVHGWKGMNPKSSKQISEMLFDWNDLPPHPKYNRSTQLEALTPNIHNPAVAAVLRYRTVEKGIGSFFLKYKRLGIPKADNPNVLVLHSSFKQTGTDTRRFSSSDPNLQQVSSPESSRHGTVLDIREVFGPEEGNVWLASDYDGQEIRLYAEASQEPNMMKALAEGRDIHSMVISKICGGEGNRISLAAGIRALSLDREPIGMTDVVRDARKALGVKDRPYSLKDGEKIAAVWLGQFGWDIEKAEKSLKRKNTRGRLKQATFGRCYGISAKKLADTLVVPREEAQDLLGIYDELFPDMGQYMRDCIHRVKKDGFVLTLWGHRLDIDPDRAYTAVNYIIQGSASDLLKHAMINLHRWFKEDGMDANLVKPIHDEIISRIGRRTCTLPFVRRYADVMEDNGGHLKYRIPTKPLLITKSWSKPRPIVGYKYAS